MFERFDNRYDLRGRLTTRTGIHIGTGGSLTVVESDNPVIRDINGWPYIPGSSFKGTLRSGIEAIVRTLSPDGRQEPWACDPLNEQTWCVGNRKALRNNQEYDPQHRYDAIGFEDLQEAAGNDDAKLTEWLVKESCTVCRLFGSPWLASKVKVADLYLHDGEKWVGRVEIRDGVAIDRDTETVFGGRKYDFEVVPRETTFDLHLRVDNASAGELGLLFIGLREFTNGSAWIGGNSSRGLGQVQIEWEEFEVVAGRHGLLNYLRTGIGELRDTKEAREALEHEMVRAFLAPLTTREGNDAEETAQSSDA
jgi:CRISPR-associated protein Csm3